MYFVINICKSDSIHSGFAFDLIFLCYRNNKIKDQVQIGMHINYNQRKKKQNFKIGNCVDVHILFKIFSIQLICLFHILNVKFNRIPVGITTF